MNLFRYFLPAFKKNWKVVVLSILGATTFWFFNAMSKNYDARLDYPLSYVFDRDSVIVVEPLQDKVKIDVSSGGWNLLRKTFRVNAIPIVIELENPTDIRYLTRGSLIPLITEQLDGLELTYVITDTLFFHIEKKVVRKIPIRVDSLNIPLAENHRLVSPIGKSQDSVVVIGPKTLMAGLPKFMNVKFSDDQIDADFDEHVTFDLENRALMSTIPDEAKLSFSVDPFVNKKLEILVENLNFPKDSSIYPSRSNIAIHYIVNENQEDEVIASDFHVIVDFTMKNGADSTVAPLLMYAHEMALDILLEPDRIKLIYAK